LFWLLLLLLLLLTGKDAEINEAEGRAREIFYLS